MANRTFTSDHSRSQVYARKGWIDKLWLVGLFLCAIVLYGINLGNLPIVDLGNEGNVAQIAREIYQSLPQSNKWIYPTLWGEPYINHPPFLYVLIAIAYHFGGVNEWTIRLPSALLSALSVPLLYLIGKEIFTVRLPALLAAFIYLTSLPILHYGRLAIIDSAVLCFFLLMMWCVLRSRRDLRFALGIGISLGLICLTKGLEGLLLSLVGLIFLIWDTPRLLTSVYLWTGIIIGSAPISAWYWSQWLKYKQLLIVEMIKDLEWFKFGIHFSSIWYYLLAICSPFLLFFKKGLSHAHENQNLSRGKLVIAWLITSVIAVLLMPTKE
ncbi:MAG TPA: glycosyltransferase family 39 protein, partial [Allocoleopsis sp.]